MAIARLALVRQLERCSPRRGYQHLVGTGISGDCRLYWQQNRPAVERDRPAVAQRINRLRHAAGGRRKRRGQRLNSVVSGT